MKTSKLYLLPLCFLVLTACPGPKDNGGDTPAKDEKLSSPQLSLNAERNGLTWAAVSGAVSYSISVNEGEATEVREPGYAFATEAEEYTVKVVAKAQDAKNNSDAAEFSYTTAYTALGNVAYADGFITWTGFIGAGLKYSIDGGEEVAVEGESIAVTTGGMYTIKAVGGFVEDGNKYYVDNASSVHEQHILARPAMTADIELEMGDEDSNADLQGKYKALKWASNSWADATTTLTLDRNNEGMSADRCVRANIYCNDTWYKWRNDDFSCTGRVNYFSFYAKAAARSQARLYFRWEVTEDTIIAGLNFKDVYVTYPIDNLDSNWKQYVVSVDDPAWKINYNGADMSFAQVQGVLSSFGYNAETLGDFFQYFGNFAILSKAATADNGAKSYVYVDEVKLGVGELPAEKDYTVHEWAFTSTGLTSGYLRFCKDRPAINTLSVKVNNGAKIKMTPVVTQLAENRFNVVVDSVSYQLNANFTVGTDGKITLEDGATGNAAALLAGLQSDFCYVIDDFESYANSGVGLDGSHKDETAWNGLRSKWYSDYNSGNNTNQSAVGGSGWSMMGSSDYLDLNKVAGYCHSGSQSMRLKYNASNQMRFITWDFTQGPAPRFPKAQYLTMYVRACESRDNHLKIKAFYNEHIQPSNQGGDNISTLLDTTVPADANHGWVKLTIELNQEKNYFGIVILPMKNSGATSGDGQYFYVDDIVLHNTINPFNY